MHDHIEGRVFSYDLGVGFAGDLSGTLKNGRALIKLSWRPHTVTYCTYIYIYIYTYKCVYGGPPAMYLPFGQY